MAPKHHYKKKLLRWLLIEGENDVSLDFLKSANMKTVTELIIASLGEIKESMPCRSWRKIMPIKEPKESKDQTERLEDGNEGEQEYIHEFQELEYSMDESEISTWLNSDSSDLAFS